MGERKTRPSWAKIISSLAATALLVSCAPETSGQPQVYSAVSCDVQTDNQQANKTSAKALGCTCSPDYVTSVLKPSNPSANWPSQVWITTTGGIHLCPINNPEQISPKPVITASLKITPLSSTRLPTEAPRPAPKATEFYQNEMAFNQNGLEFKTPQGTILRFPAGKYNLAKMHQVLDPLFSERLTLNNIPFAIQKDPQGISYYNSFGKITHETVPGLTVINWDRKLNKDTSVWKYVDVLSDAKAYIQYSDDTAKLNAQIVHQAAHLATLIPGLQKADFPASESQAKLAEQKYLEHPVIFYEPIESYAFIMGEKLIPVTDLKNEQISIPAGVNLTYITPFGQRLIFHSEKHPGKFNLYEIKTYFDTFANAPLPLDEVHVYITDYIENYYQEIGDDKTTSQPKNVVGLVHPLLNRGTYSFCRLVFQERLKDEPKLTWQTSLSQCVEWKDVAQIQVLVAIEPYKNKGTDPNKFNPYDYIQINTTIMHEISGHIFRTNQNSTVFLPKDLLNAEEDYAYGLEPGFQGWPLHFYVPN